MTRKETNMFLAEFLIKRGYSFNWNAYNYQLIHNIVDCELYDTNNSKYIASVEKFEIYEKESFNLIKDLVVFVWEDGKYYITKRNMTILLKRYGFYNEQ